MSHAQKLNIIEVIFLVVGEHELKRHLVWYTQMYVENWIPSPLEVHNTLSPLSMMQLARYVWVYFLKRKNELLSGFLEWKTG